MGPLDTSETREKVSNRGGLHLPETISKLAVFQAFTTPPCRWKKIRQTRERFAHRLRSSG
jgi:hypothetical protein